MTIEAHSITFHYPNGPEVLSNVSVRASAGEVVALIGPNAAGKTTLLRLFAGVLRPQQGEIKLHNRPLAGWSIRDRARHVAFVAQRPQVEAPFSVEEVIQLGQFALTSRAARTGLFDQVISDCGLQKLVDRPFHRLSVGQQQRVSIARALVQLQGGGEDKVLLLDEPMSAMDPRHILHCGRILKKAARAGTAIMIVLHDLPLVTSLADACWGLHGEKVLPVSMDDHQELTAACERMYEIQFWNAHDTRSNATLPRYDFQTRS